MKIQSVLIFTLILFILFLPNNLFAQWSTTPDSNLQVSTFGQFPEACSDGKGGVYIAFESFDYEHSHVYVQYVNRYGYIQWNPAVDLGDRGGLEGEHRVVEDGSGGVIIYYDLLTPIDTIENEIYYKSEATLQKLDSLGNRLWGPNGVKASLDTSDQRIMDVVTDGNGGAIMIWKDFYGIFPDTIRLNTQRISGSGQRMWGDSGIVINKNIGGSSAKIISDANGGAIITYGRQYKKVDSNGIIVWTSSAYQGYSSIASDDKGGAILAGITSIDSHYGLTSNYLLQNGNFLWDSLGVIIEDSVEISSLVGDMKLLKDSLFVVFWTNINLTGNIFTAYIQYLKLNGDILFPNKSLSVSKISSETAALNIIESDDAFIFTFKDIRNGKEVYGQKYDTAGVALWDSTDILIISREFNNIASTISDLNDGAIIIFSDSPLYGIFAQQISKNGNLGEILTGISYKEETKIPGKYQLHQNYPNPFNGTTSIGYNISNKSEISINIYNILGEKIRSFSRNHVSGGNYSIVWDGKNINGKEVSSGIYLYQIETENFTQTKKLIYLK